MDEIIKNPAVQFLAYTLPILLPYVLRNRVPRGRHPRYAIRTEQPIRVPSDSVAEVRIKVRGVGQMIDRIGISRLAFWNVGDASIERKHVKVPITFASNGEHRFLAASVVHQTKPSTNCKAVLSPDGSKLSIDFEYLNRHDGDC